MNRALSFSMPHRSFLTLGALILLFSITSTPVRASVILSETFEGGTLSSNLSVGTVGGYISSPGIRDETIFGSAKAFGFGLSTCPLSCFDNHVTSLLIDFGSPTAVTSLSFKEMEVGVNWGSGGAIFVDGALFGTTHYDFGRLPYNDFGSDQIFRTHTFDLNRTATTIELRVRDITNSSEILLDDLAINGTLNPVPLPSSGVLMLMGSAVLLLLGAFRTRSA